MENNVIVDSIIKLVDQFKELEDLNKNGEFDYELALSVFQKEVDITLLQTVAGLYGVIKDHHLISAYSNFCQLKPNKSIRDFHDNMLALNVGVKQMVQEGAEKANRVAGMMNLNTEYTKEWYQSCKDFSSFYNNLLSFAGTATFVSENLESKKYNRAYYKGILKNLVFMSNILENASKKVSCLVDRAGDIDALNAFDRIYIYFMESTSVIKKLLEELMNRSSVERKIDEFLSGGKPQIDKSRVFVSSAVDEKQRVRLNAIKEANDMYEMFQIDFMRDLNKEVSMMNRDMYNALITKIEKFLKKFPMPLANDASLGMAQEAKAQIGKFIDMVGEISRNTYTPMVLNR